MTDSGLDYDRTGKQPAWRIGVPEAELERLQNRGFGESVPLGARPCLIVVDVVMSFLGPRPGVEGQMDYATSCGDSGWEALPYIVDVLEAARRAQIPRVLCKGWPEAAEVIGGAIKLSRDPITARKTHSAPFPDEIIAREDEFVMQKAKASAFFQTPLLTYLHQHQADSVIIVGTTTSGCIRATAVDAASYGFPVVVVEDACFDRSQYAHAANLFDIQMKYGEVLPSSKAIHLINAIDRS